MEGATPDHSFGTHTITLAFTDADANMNGEVNAAHLDHLRLTRLADSASASGE